MVFNNGSHFHRFSNAMVNLVVNASAIASPTWSPISHRQAASALGWFDAATAAEESYIATLGARRYKVCAISRDELSFWSRGCVRGLCSIRILCQRDMLKDSFCEISTFEAAVMNFHLSERWAVQACSSWQRLVTTWAPGHPLPGLALSALVNNLFAAHNDSSCVS